MEGKNPQPGIRYRMPAEWESHEATWLSWPKNLETFPKDIIGKVEETFVEMVRALYTDERVNILVNDAKAKEHARSMLESVGIKIAKGSNIVFQKIVSSDVWIRDYGPTFVKTTAASAGDGTGTVKAIKWTYNAYGKKYDDLAYDDKTGEEIVKASGKEVIRPELILEGGSIEVNGKGTLITTEQCLLNKNRNSKLVRKEIEKRLESLLGVKNIIWLGEGVVGDDTDGHIDDIARFVGDRKVVCVIEPNKSDENHLALKKDFETLERSRDQDGNPLEVIPLPMPGPVVNRFGRLPASYANFYIGNKAVLLPVFKDKNGADEKAIAILEECFDGKSRNGPRRKVVPIDARYLVWGLGTIHCSTQQEPK